MEHPPERLGHAKAVAVGCDHLPEMVKRGSPVRVRQRALQKPPRWRLFCRRHLHELQYAVGMEPFMEPSGSERAPQASENRRIRRKDRRMAPSRHEQDELDSPVLAGDPTAAPRAFELLLDPLIERLRFKWPRRPRRDLEDRRSTRSCPTSGVDGSSPSEGSARSPLTRDAPAVRGRSARPSRRAVVPRARVPLGVGGSNLAEVAPVPT